MSVSIPSREVYNFNVPEIKKFSATFRYNFFTTDEKTNESGIVPEEEFKLNVGSFDSATVKRFTSKLPRMVEFRIVPPRLNMLNVSVDELNRAIFSKRASIINNLDKIVSEDDLAANSFVSLNFNDSNIKNKIRDVISGSLVEFKLDNSMATNVGDTKAVKVLAGEFEKAGIDAKYLTRYFNGLDDKLIKFFSTSEGKDRVRKMSNERSELVDRNGKLQLNDIVQQDLNSVSLSVQINSKIFNDIVKSQIVDPSSLLSNDMLAIEEKSRNVQSAARRNVLPSDNDYRTIVPFVDVANASNYTGDTSTIQLTGFIIDRNEVLSTGQYVDLEPIIIESPTVSYAIDTRVKYGSRYRYQIRCVFEVTVPASDDDTGDVVVIRTLVCSKPSSPVYVTCDEELAPPPPCDLTFNWNHKTDQMTLGWSLPVNTQRDIKYFQVFRRKSINESYELMKMYDFDDSNVRTQLNEFPNLNVLEHTSSPVMYWVDDEFTKQSRFIYSVVCIDAHGMSSGYSVQHEVWFDQFRNRLMMTQVSHSGAPKPYPNMYVPNNLFVDAIKTSGSKRLKLYFNPEYYDSVDNDGRRKKIIGMIQDGCSYVLNVMNTDNQRMETVSITIDDRRSSVDGVNAQIGPKTKN